MSLVDEYMKWRRKAPSVGCVFANFMASAPSQHGQRAELVLGTDPHETADKVVKCVGRSVDAPEVAALTVLLPELTTLDSLVAVALALKLHPGWSVTRNVIAGAPGGDVVAFYISLDLAFGNGAIPSEVLVLGPFAEFPNTRVAPTTAMELFVGTPLAVDRKTQQPSKKANVAHVKIEDALPTAATFDRMWTKSQERRLDSLAGVDDPRAKAKVAFCIPLALAASLGCVP